MSTPELHATRTLTGICALQVAGWTLAPALSHSAPPLDVVEMYLWGREGVVATFKHPNLPGLLLEGTRRLTGGAVWPAYLIAQLAVVGAFASVFALGRDLLGEREALAGTLLLTGVYYYSWPTPELNHNVLQLPFWAFIPLALWRAVTTDRLRWWVLLGAASGLVMWAKYTAIFLLVAGAVWMLLDSKARHRLAGPGPWLALTLQILVSAPQTHYLVTSNFLPLENATLRLTGIEADPRPAFLGAQLGAHVLLLVMATVGGIFRRRPLPHSPPDENARPRVRRFLGVILATPLLLLGLASRLPGFGLRDMWGLPMFNLSGLLLLAWRPRRLDAAGLGRITRFAVALLLLVPTVYAALTASRPHTHDTPRRTHWPQAEIADHLTRLYEAETGRPLCVIAGPPWEAGLIALTAPSKPSVLLEGSFVRSPWVEREALDDGFLAVWPDELGPSPSLSELLESFGVTERRRAVFPWSERPSAEPVAVGYAVVPPRDS